jgi:molecular chaperone GrpE (heat shock protein)
VRKQGQNLVEDAKKFGVQSLLKDMIHVFDTLDIVLENTRVGHQADVEEAKRDFQSFHEAVVVLEKDLMKSLTKHGVVKVIHFPFLSFRLANCFVLKVSSSWSR